MFEKKEGAVREYGVRKKKGEGSGRPRNGGKKKNCFFQGHSREEGVFWRVGKVGEGRGNAGVESDGS